MKHFFAAIFLFLCFSPEVKSSVQLEEKKKFSESKIWRRLLHFSPISSLTFTSKHSRVLAGSNFFLSKEGYKNPSSELEADLQLFNSPMVESLPEKQNPYCLFPARARVLQEKGFIQSRKVSCPKRDDWLTHSKADEVRLIFAAQYNSNPMSMMGHTFLYFQNNQHREYLNRTLGYAATIPDDASALAFAYKGIFGGFNGIFSVQPYYEKLHEYANMEMRDIWEYTLRLSSSQKQIFLEHLWELVETSQFSYYFLDENCAYLVLAAIEVADEDTNLITDHKIYLLPHESIKTLSRSGLIASEKYRPSLATQLIFSFSKLSSDEKNIFYEAESFKSIEKIQTVAVANALIDHLATLRYRQRGKLPPEDEEFEKKLLVRRSELGIESIPAPPTPPSPLVSDDPYHFEVGGVHSSQSGAYTMYRLRPATHVMMDRDPGYLKNSALNVLDTEAWLGTKGQGAELRRLNFVEVANRNQSTEMDPRSSFGLRLFYEKSEELWCYKCNIFGAEFRFGKTYALTENLNFISFLYLAEQSSDQLPHRGRLLPGLELQLIWLQGLRFKISQTELYRFDATDSEGMGQLQSLTQFRWYRIFSSWDLALETQFESYSKRSDVTGLGFVKVVTNF